MPSEPSRRAPNGPENGNPAAQPAKARGDGFAGGCISLILLLIEIPVAVLLWLTSALRGWASTDGATAEPARDWAPVLWFGGFTLGVLAIAVIFLCTAHPYAGAVQLLLAAVALLFTLAAWPDQHERAPQSVSRAAPLSSDMRPFGRK
ncbi:MAG: hypothetical protein HOV92_22995 [Streptomyces sp.]|nr:hypothetical protein [Streptomyces sp.]